MFTLAKSFIFVKEVSLHITFLTVFLIIIEDMIHPYNCLLKNVNFSVKTSNDEIISYTIK